MLSIMNVSHVSIKVLWIAVPFEQQLQVITSNWKWYINIWKEIKEANWIKLLQQADGSWTVFKVNWNPQYQAIHPFDIP